MSDFPLQAHAKLNICWLRCDTSCGIAFRHEITQVFNVKVNISFRVPSKKCKNTDLITFLPRLRFNRIIFRRDRRLLFAANICWLPLSYKEKIYSYQSSNTVKLKHLPQHTTGQLCLHPHLIISPGLRCLSHEVVT